jgi:hypothetical protein
MPATASRVGRREWARRIAWLVAIWAASVATLAAVALVLKWLMRLVGMSS